MGYHQKFLQLSDNKYLYIPYEEIRYDTTAKWYIAFNNKGGRAAFDSTGELIIPFISSVINPIHDPGYLIVNIFNKGKQVISASGEFMFDMKYENVVPILNQLYIVTLDGKRGIVNKDDKIILPLDYEEVFVQYSKIHVRKTKETPRQMYDLITLLNN